MNSQEFTEMGRQATEAVRTAGMRPMAWIHTDGYRTQVADNRRRNSGEDAYIIIGVPSDPVSHRRCSSEDEAFYCLMYHWTMETAEGEEDPAESAAKREAELNEIAKAELTRICEAVKGYAYFVHIDGCVIAKYLMHDVGLVTTRYSSFKDRYYTVVKKGFAEVATATHENPDELHMWLLTRIAEREA